MIIIKKPIHLHASPKAVVPLFLNLGGDRINNIVHRVERLDEKKVNELTEALKRNFYQRHRNIQQVFREHVDIIENEGKVDLLPLSPAKKLLLGAFFTKEYSIQAAALFNPSIVSHPDQQNLKPGEQRFIMSLRATGEGHISSIVFKTGIVNAHGDVVLDTDAQHATRLQKVSAAKISNTEYDLAANDDLPINEMVIFPMSADESMGMEDVRFVKFSDHAETCYYGTYTAYNGKNIQSKLVETKDFKSFQIRSLHGSAISDKGMALLPEKVNGNYVMISRQGGETINIMYSTDVYTWNSYKVLMTPQYPWELIQLGNCGSPVKTEKGWLLLTHGVGVMRTYVISAVLLDLQDPSRITGRLELPLIEAEGSEREGYVPNVVYTCGVMLHEEMLIIPYAVSDSATAFATIPVNEILNEMKPYSI